MGSITAPQVRSAIRRVLRAQVDGKLSRSGKSAIWRYFENRCAYCQKTLDPTSRAGHIDHLVPTSLGGSDHISNRVLACGVCNGDDKREADWRDFLRAKRRQTPCITVGFNALKIGSQNIALLHPS